MAQSVLRGPAKAREALFGILAVVLIRRGRHTVSDDKWEQCQTLGKHVRVCWGHECRLRDWNMKRMGYRNGFLATQMIGEDSGLK
jgi:hypothetical protein